MGFELSSKQVVPDYKLSDFLDGLSAAVGTSKAKKKIKVGGNSMTLELVSFAENSEAVASSALCTSFHTGAPVRDLGKSGYAVCYITITNNTEAAQVKKDRNNGSVSTNDLTVDEDYIFGAHVFIDKSWDAARKECRVYIESVRHLGQSHIEGLLRYIIDQLHREKKAMGQMGFLIGVDKNGKKKNGAPLRHGYRIMPTISGIPSENIKSIVDGGLATSLYLERKKNGVTLGGRNWLKPKSEEVKLVIDKKNMVANAWDDLVQLLNGNKGEYGSARLKFKTPEGDNGEATIDPETGNILHGKFIKGTIVKDVSPTMGTSAGGIVPHFAEGFFKILP